MPPVSEPRRPVTVSKSWRERPRRRARGVAPRLSGRVVHATACLSVSADVASPMCGEYAPPADHDLRADHERNLQVDQVHVDDSFLRRLTRKICATF
jgi:hypothetical protein